MSERRDGIRHHSVDAGGLSMHVAEAGEGPLVVLCHGFPELWYSWRHQLSRLAGAGYRAVAPDQRGYGGTDAPDEIAAYDLLHLTGDLLGLLDMLGEDRAVFVGHDWGAIVVWHLAVMAPERVRAVAALSVPFVPRPPAPPTQILRAWAGDRFLYILYFQEVGPADRELARDARRALAKIYWSNSGDRSGPAFKPLPRWGTGFLDGMDDPPSLPAWLTEEDLDYLSGEFARTGFTGPLNWYRNFDRNWELTERFAGAHVTVPSLFLAGERDPVLRMTPPEVMGGWLEEHRGTVLLPGCGHWTQQERPEEVNQTLLRFLAELPARA